jgi:hypothetical protein
MAIARAQLLKELLPGLNALFGMGYRSEVMAAFYTTNKDEAPLLKLFIEENWPKSDNLTAYEWL